MEEPVGWAKGTVFLNRVGRIHEALEYSRQRRQSATLTYDKDSIPEELEKEQKSQSRGEIFARA